jgi:hypothetical protein
MFSGRLDGGCDARSGFGEADATAPFIFGNEFAENDPESGDGNARAKAQRRKDQRLLTIQALSSHSPIGQTVWHPPSVRNAPPFAPLRLCARNPIPVFRIILKPAMG